MLGNRPRTLLAASLRLPWVSGACPCSQAGTSSMAALPWEWGSSAGPGLVRLVFPACRIITPTAASSPFSGYPFIVFYFFHVFVNIYQPLLICVCYVVENCSST